MTRLGINHVVPPALSSISCQSCNRSYLFLPRVLSSPCFQGQVFDRPNPKLLSQSDGPPLPGDACRAAGVRLGGAGRIRALAHGGPLPCGQGPAGAEQHLARKASNKNGMGRVFLKLGAPKFAQDGGSSFGFSVSPPKKGMHFGGELQSRSPKKTDS